MKTQPLKEADRSLESTFLTDVAPASQSPIFATKTSLRRLFGMKSSDTLEEVLLHPKKKNQS